MTRCTHAAVASLLLLTGATSCAGELSSKAGVYEARTEEVTLPTRTMHVTYVKPLTPRSRQFLILFATGDAGWFGVSGTIFEHLADEGYAIAAFDSRAVLKPVKHSGKLIEIPAAASAVDSILVQARVALGLPETTPVIVTGFSRGANLVVFTAGVESLQHHLLGALAIALTRETDFLRAPDEAHRPPSVQIDDKGRIQTYPAIALAGSIPFAVIQSEGDSYVPAEEARQLFGPDSPTRRLYEVDARNHGFSGGRDELIRDLDDALEWIEQAARSR